MTARRRARRDAPEVAERAVTAPEMGGPVSQATPAGTGAVWRFTLAYPPSTNNLYLTAGRRRVKSPEARAYVEYVELWGLMRAIHGTPVPPYALTIELWAPDARRRDVDNAAKVIQDGIVRATGHDDAVVTALHVYKRGIDRRHPRAEVTLEHAAERRDGGEV